MHSNPLRFVALLNRLWDGKSFTAHRKTSDNYTLEDRRLTINLMMQPLLLQKIANAVSGIGRQSGFLARCLLAHPESAMGTRFYQEPPMSREFMTDFEARITACLQQTEHLTHQGCYNLPTLSLSNDAKQKWIIFFNSLEILFSYCLRVNECTKKYKPPRAISHFCSWRNQRPNTHFTISPRAISALGMALV